MAKFHPNQVVRCEWDTELTHLIKQGELYIVEEVMEMYNPDEWIDCEWLYLRGVREEGCRVAIRAVRFSPVR